MSALAALLAAQLLRLAGGQLAGAPAGEVPVGDAKVAEVPAPLPGLPPTPPAPLLAPTPPPAPDRVRTADGRVHLGRVLREIDNGLEFENRRGERYPIALAAVVGLERGGGGGWQLPPEPQVPAIDPEGTREALRLAFDVYEAERQRAALTYGEKALVCALGVVAAVVGFAAVRGETGTAVGVVGAVGAAGGGTALGVTALRSRRLTREAEAARARLGALGAGQASRAEVHLPALALRF